MIIFGTRGVKSTLQEGEFMCPQCATTKPYKLKKVTKFFTLYFIPLIPLERLGEYVECQSCKGTFVPRVLDYDPNKDKNEFQAHYEQAMRHSMVLIMLADGEIDAKEMEIVLKIINKFGHNNLTLEELENYVHQVQAKQEPVQTYLSKIGPSLNEHGKEIIVKCALSVAAADGNIGEKEIRMITEMAKIMEMPPSHLKGIFHELTKPEPEFSNN